MFHLAHRLLGDDSFQYVGDLMGGRFVTEQEHLSCFIPGLLALASQTEAITGNRYINTNGYACVIMG